MKLTLIISDAQFERLEKIGQAMRATPHELALPEILESLDGWSSWKEFESQRVQSIRFYADEGKASLVPAEQRLENQIPQVPEVCHG
jgi:hypothetical protein